MGPQPPHHVAASFISLAATFYAPHEKSPRAHSATAPFRKRSRSARLLVCKRTHNGALSLPTFCGFQGLSLSLFTRGVRLLGLGGRCRIRGEQTKGEGLSEKQACLLFGKPLSFSLRAPRAGGLSSLQTAAFTAIKLPFLVPFRAPKENGHVRSPPRSPKQRHPRRHQP